MDYLNFPETRGEFITGRKKRKRKRQSDYRVLKLGRFAKKAKQREGRRDSPKTPRVLLQNAVLRNTAAFGKLQIQMCNRNKSTTHKP